MKKWMKIAGVLLFSLPVVVQAEDYAYTTDNGAITITGYTGVGGAVTITNSINGLPVTSIGSNAFYSYTNLTSVIIPNGVTNIGGYAFYNCTELTNATIPSSVTSIRTYAFYCCKKLLNVTIPDGVNNIGRYALYGTALTNITIPSSLAQIGERAFPQQSLKAIEADGLNPWYCSTNGILFNKDKTTLVLYPGGAATSYEIPNYVSCIGTHAFDSCTRLTGVTILGGVTRIEDHAFFSAGLTNIVIPGCVTNIGERAVTGCSSLTAIVVDPLNQYYSSSNGVLFNKSQTRIIAYPAGAATSYTIPNSVSTIGDDVFYGCTNLASVAIPNSVTNIGGCAFLRCTSLTSVTVPSSLTDIGYTAFYGCTKLTSVYFVGNAPTIDAAAFNNFTNATVYYLPNTTGWTNPWGGLPTALWTPDSLLVISNVVVTQRAGIRLVDITYDVSSTYTNRAWISLTPICTSAVVNASSLTGDVGEVSVGTGKAIVWDAGADWNGNLAGVSFILTPTEIPPPQGMVLIPAGTNSGTDPDFGSYSLTVTNPFYMDATEVTKAQWDVVYSWALTNGYSFDNTGSGKATNHPVQTVNWYDCVKWCNARSEMNGLTPCYTTTSGVYRTGDFGVTNDPDVVLCDFNANGYYLPKQDQWVYAARGGLSGKRFPWGDTITHSNANYYSTNSYSYDVSSTGYHPFYDDAPYPYTSPTGSFSANSYGLYDMAGNLQEWCWELSGTSTWYRRVQGGSWHHDASYLRCDRRGYTVGPSSAMIYVGFRAICNAVGTSNNFLFLSSVTAVTDTRDYVLSIFSAHGMLVPSVGTHSYARLASVTCSVENITSDGWMFMGWMGDISTDYTATNTVVVMDALSKNITAQYSDDADSDGLLNTNELGIGTNPRMKDTDGDNFDDNFEVNEGMNPLKDNSAIGGYIQSHDETFGLYASNAVLDVAVGEVLLRTQSGQARLQLQVERSDDLQSWTNAGSVVEWTLPLDGNKKFFRIKASK